LKRVGLFGGTFNPVHVGHLQVIQEVKENFVLDKVYIIPAAIPPHKELGCIADAKDRFEMINLSILNFPAILKSVVVSDVELKRLGPSYTIDTVKYYLSIFPENTTLYLILGLDAFLEINTWKFFMDFFSITSFIVISRPGVCEDKNYLLHRYVEDYLKAKISKNYKLFPLDSCCCHELMQPVFCFEAIPCDVSSTMIRSYIKNGRSVKNLITENVGEYIKVKGLYK